MIRKALSPSLRLLTPLSCERSPSRLILFPYAGAGAYIYRSWVQDLPNGLEVVAVQLPGREDRFHEPPIDDLTEALQTVADELTEFLAPTADWLVFGHSLGAVLAMEVARTLTADKGWDPARHVMVSGSRALHLIHRNRLPVHELTDADLVEHMRALNGTPEEILADDALMETILRLVRADYSLFDQYEHRNGLTISSPITVFAGDADPSTSPDTIDPWASLTTESCRVHTLPGDHFFLNQSRRLLLELVNEILKEENIPRR